jgi:hypothetical protein
VEASVAWTLKRAKSLDTTVKTLRMRIALATSVFSVSKDSQMITLAEINGID